MANAPFSFGFCVHSAQYTVHSAQGGVPGFLCQARWRRQMVRHQTSELAWLFTSGGRELGAMSQEPEAGNRLFASGKMETSDGQTIRRQILAVSPAAMIFITPLATHHPALRATFLQRKAK